MKKNAAVAAVFFKRKVILMRRKRRTDDPWSGDMSFPGGFVREGETPIEGAMREFEEETGIDRGKLIFYKEYDVFHPVRFGDINVKPFLFRTDQEYAITPGDEMEYGKWYILSRAIEKSNEIFGNYIEIEGDIVWGLTYRILSEICRKDEGILKTE